jgi:NitT/TauT family transport system substrate-binding protein
MKIAVPDLISNSYFPVVAATELGFFTAEGLDLALELIYPVDKAYQMLRDGRVEFVGGAAHAVPAVFPDWRGAKLLAALAQGMYWFMVMRADVGARRGDLSIVKGRRIGAAPMVELGLKRLLVTAGIDLVRDRVTIAPVPGSAAPGVNFGMAAAKALEEGKIDGFWANGMGAETAVRRGIGTVVLDVRRGDGPPAAFHYTMPVLVAAEGFVARDPACAAAAVRALVRTHKALKADIRRATEAANKVFPAAEAALAADVVARDLAYYDPAISKDAFDRINQFVRKMGLARDPLPYDDVVATELRHLWTA